MASSTSKAILILQIIVATIVIAWLSYDFFYTLTQGITYKIRLNDTLDFRQHPFVFIVTVLLKVFVYGFFIWLFRDCLKKYKQ